MKFVYHYYMVHSKKRNQDYYYVSLDLVDENGVLKFKGSPILWIDKDTYDKLMSNAIK